MNIKTIGISALTLIVGFVFFISSSYADPVENQSHAETTGSFESSPHDKNNASPEKTTHNQKAYPQTGPLAIPIKEAVLISLENNQAFQMERLNPRIRRTFEIEEQAAFDATVSLEETLSKTKYALPTDASSLTEIERSDGSVQLSKRFATGTEVTLDVSANRSDASSSSDLSSARVGISITQALLRGYGINANLADLRQARLNTLASQYELRGYAESLVADVEKTCWDYVLAKRRIGIFQDSLKLAEDQLWETRQRIDIGKLAKVEVYAAQAEVAFRREALINARSDLALTRLQLQRLLNLPGDNPLESDISIIDEPFVSEANLDKATDHVQVALRWRPELNQTRLEIQQGDLEIIKTKNGLLPLLDLFITMGKTEYSDTFGDAFTGITDGSYNITAGISFEYPIRRRADKARHKRALLTRQQSEEALQNLAQLVEVDVRSALIEIKRTREQVTATEFTRKLQEETLRAETEKFRVGKSTALLVARAQRDLVLSQISEIEAVITYRKALIDLYQMEGSLLERRGIIAPGQEPVELTSGEAP